MKNTTLLIGLLFFCGVLYGQEEINTNNTARLGVSRAFFGDGVIIGPAIFAEYSYSLNDYFAITPRIISAYAHDKMETTFDHASSFVTSLSISITPFPNSFRRLKVDIGALYHKLIDIYGSRTGDEFFATNTFYTNEDLFGLIGALSFNIIDTKKIESGVRFDLLTSFREGFFDADSYQTGIYIGLKF